LLNVALLVTLLVSPYLYSYDYILLLVPFLFLLFPKSGVVEKFIVLISYLMPLVFISAFGRAGNISLLASTLLIGALVFLRVKSSVDVPTFAA
jgi:hypothetical protein